MAEYVYHLPDRYELDQGEVLRGAKLHKKQQHVSVNMPDFSVAPAQHMEVEVESDRKARVKREIDVEYARKVLLANKKANVVPTEVPLPPATMDEDVPLHNLKEMPYYRKRKYRRSSCCGSSTRKRRRSIYPRAFPRSKYGATFVKRGTDENIALYGKDYASASGIQLANRRNTGFSGRGAYGIGKAIRHGARHLIHQGIKEVKHLGGEMLHDAVNAGRAAFDASPEGQAFNAIYGAVGGRGAYEVTSNQLINPSGPSNAMTTSADETNDVTFSRSEFLQDISSDSTKPFNTVFSASLNPGLTAFPWLSQIACFFEEYEWIQLIFEVRSMVTEGNTTAGGTIVHATQYNPANGLFTSKQKMENYEYANSHKVTDHGQHGVECDPAKRAGSAAEYVRTGPVPSGQDIKSYDLGLYQLAITGATATVNIGELWVHYTVKLKKTKIPDPGAVVNISAPTWQGTGTQVAANAWGALTQTAGSNITPVVTGGLLAGVPLVITLPSSFLAAQLYEILFSFVGPTAASTTPLLGLAVTASNATVTGVLSLPFNSVAAANNNITFMTSFTPTGAGPVVLTIAPGTVLPAAGIYSISINLKSQ